METIVPEATPVADDPLAAGWLAMNVPDSNNRSRRDNKAPCRLLAAALDMPLSAL
jgi:hypothetical protein